MNCKNLLLIVLVLVVSGCAGLKGQQPDFRAVYPYSFDQVSKATFDALSEMPIEVSSIEKGTVETRWVEGWGDRSFGAFGGYLSGGQWKRRAKVISTVKRKGDEQAQVQLIIRMQEKAPGGAQANYWKRIYPDKNMPKNIFAKIQQELEE